MKRLPIRRLTTPALELPRMMFRPAIALVLLLNGGLAAAESSPYYIGVSQAFTRDSNVYRIDDATALPAGLKRGDSYSTTSLLAGVDQALGRQRLFGSAALRANRFSDNESLNNESYSANVGVDWATVNRLSGRISAGARQNLARFNPDDEVPTLVTKNIERTQQFDASVRLGVVTRWTGEANVGWRKVGFSANEFRAREFEQTSASLGLRHSTSAALTLGAFVRRTDGKYPLFRALGSGGFAADEFDRNDLDLTAAWTPTGASTLDARLTFGRVNHSEASQRDFSGATGLVRWQWKPTGKLRVNTSLARDTGEETAFLDFGTSQTIASDAFSKTTTSVRVQADYDLSAKVQVGAGTSHARRSLSSTVSLPNGSSIPRDGRDTTSSYTLNARWSPLRSLQLSCDVSRDRRSASGGLSDAYSVTIYGCSGQFLLQ